MVAAYTPTYYDEAVGLPAPEGIYGKEVHSTKTGAAQVTEARLLLDLIQTQDPVQYAKLTDTSAPMPVLIKVPGTSRVRDAAWILGSLCGGSVCTSKLTSRWKISRPQGGY